MYYCTVTQITIIPAIFPVFAEPFRWTFHIFHQFRHIFRNGRQSWCSNIIRIHTISLTDFFATHKSVLHTSTLCFRTMTLHIIFPWSFYLNNACVRIMFFIVLLSANTYSFDYIHLIRNKTVLRYLSKTEIYIRPFPIHNSMIRVYYRSKVCLSIVWWWVNIPNGMHKFMILTCCCTPSVHRF